DFGGSFARSSSVAYAEVLREAFIPLPDSDSASVNGDKEPSDGTGQQQPDNARLFARLISKTAKDIDLIIDSLPSREVEPELQESHIRRLETENTEQARELEAAIKRGEALLDVIKDALEDIAQNQMRMKQLEA